MNVPFDALGPQSRIWIYQSNRKFTEEEQWFILENTSRFLEAWTAHGNDLQAGVKILYDQFIIIGLNEAVNEASGCSIDKSVGFIREIENSLNITLLESSKVAFLDKTEIRLVDFSDIRQMIVSGNIKRGDKVFNNSIGSKAQLQSEWLIPAEDSWIKRYFL
jgi:hypothetical protein